MNAQMEKIEAREPSDEPRIRVGVVGVDAASGEAGAAHGAQTLLAALERAYPVRFEPADALVREGADLARAGLDGVVALDPGLAHTHEQYRCRGVPQLVLCSDPQRHQQEVLLNLSERSCLPRPLRGASIREGMAPRAKDAAIPPAESAQVLASVDGAPVWWQAHDAETGSGSLYRSSYPLAELGESETLRDHLRPGQFMGLLPLVHFLGVALGAQGWQPPPLRASFVIDDPNLHWPTYGFLDYREMAKHASRHGYHVALATVPLDGWLVDPRAASLVREHCSELSLLVHGNDHVARELGRLRTARAAEQTIAQALRRIRALELRAGVKVDRIMAPPHGACSEEALAAMFRLGIEAACISRPYPWRDELPAPTPLTGWQAAEMVAGGTPVLPRYRLDAPREELAFRALLGQPLVLYGHHQDFAQGLDPLAQAANDIDRLGEVRWCSLEQIARSNYATRREGETLHVKMHARRIAVEIPEGVNTMSIQVDEPYGGPAWRQLSHAGGTADVIFAGGQGIAGGMPVVRDANGSVRAVEVALKADRPLSPTRVASPGPRPWPSFRRTLVEGRDRAQPLLLRIASQRRLRERRVPPGTFGSR
jgi:hypothetical protein